MSGRSTTQFLLVPESRPNRGYLLALASAFWTFCLGCTVLSILVDLLFSGSVLTIVASPFIIGAALIPNIGIAFAIPRLQRFQRSNRYVLIGAFLAGAVIAIPPALVINTTLFLPIEIAKSGALTLLGYGTIPGIVEEGIKGLIVLFIFRRYRDEFHDPVDGIVIGALVGLGFAMTEDISYFAQGLSGENPFVSLALTLFLRLGLGWMNHSVFTAIMGAALGYARMGPRGKRRILIPLAGYAGAAGLHNAFDFVATLLDQLVPDNLLGLLMTIVPLYGMTWTAMAILGFVVVRGWHHEGDLVRTELADDAASGTVTAEEYAVLPKPALRRKALLEVQVRRGRPERRLLGKLYQLEIALALQKRHSFLGDAPGVPELHSEGALRQRIADLRPALLGIPAPLPVPAGGGPTALPLPPPAPPVSPPPVLAPDTRPYRLLVTEGAGVGTAIVLRDGLTIGRSTARDLILPDLEVSSMHARIARDGGPPVLIDAGSMNGTYVNGERITSRALQPGDRVRMGGVQLTVEAAPERQQA